MKRLFAGYLGLLLSFFIFHGTAVAFGQETEFEAVRDAGRAEYWGGRYEKAEMLLNNALRLAQSKGDDSAVAATLDDLGIVYQDGERLGEAERAYVTAITIFKRLPGKEYETAVVLRNLGTIYSITARYSDALQVFQQGAKLLKNKTPDEQALSAQILTSLSILYFRQGKLRQAETQIARAGELRSAAAFQSDLIDAQMLSQIGAIAQKRRKYEKAEQSYRRSLEITQQQLGLEHPYVAIALTNLANLYTEMRRHREAEGLYRHSLSILERLKPVPDGRLIDTLQALSRLYLNEGENTAAENILAQAVAIARGNPALGPSVPTLLDAYAKILKSLGKTQDAQSLVDEARRRRAALALTVRVPSRN
jgi:tetratricopeptide (TPR) repeat protein